MILTVTPNTALDLVLFIDHFSFGETVRASETAHGMGGKGAVTSWVLGQLGIPSLATGLAAGETGRRMEATLRAAGVETDFIWVAGETRTNYVLARQADGVQGTICVAGLESTLADGERLADHVRALLPRADFLLCGGTLPQGLPADWYAPLIREAKSRGIPTLLDAAEPFLSANLPALPDMIKPNAAEASALLNCIVDSMDVALDAVCALRERGIAAPVITLGEQGAVAANDEGVFYVPPLDVRVRNTAGAGDGFNAGLLLARQRGADWQEALRQAAAVAASILLTPATGACRPEDVRALYSQVRVERLF